MGHLRPGGRLELHRHRALRLAAPAREPDRRAHDPARLRVVRLRAAGRELAPVYTVALVVGGLWGAIFLHLGLSFPTGRLTDRLDRTLAIAGYFVFPLAFVPALFFASPHDLGCDDCPANLLLIRRDHDLATVLTGLGALCYLVLFGIVLAWAIRRWRATPPLDRLQLTPVYTFSLLTFLLVTVARAGVGNAAWWAAFIATGLMPFAFLAGLLRTHLSLLDAELRASLEELRASRARIVEAGDAERRRLERDLHDGAQSRLVALKLLLSSARLRAAAAATTSTPCSARRSTSSTRASRSCASSRAASTPPCSPTTAWSRRCRRSPPGRPCRWSAGRSRGAAARQRRERRLLRGLRGSGQRRQVRAGHRGGGRRAPDGRPRDRRRHRRRHRGRRCPRAARGCAAWPTGSRRSTGRCRSRAPPAAGRTCTRRSPVLRQRERHRAALTAASREGSQVGARSSGTVRASFRNTFRGRPERGGLSNRA